MSIYRMLLMSTATLSLAFITHADTVTIVQDGMGFYPQYADAAPGDTIRWEWSAGFHDVSSGDNCSPDGLYWGSMPLDSDHPVVEWEVPSDASGDIPYLCDIYNHCEQSGMWGVITVASDKSSPMRVNIGYVNAMNIASFTYEGSDGPETLTNTFACDVGDDGSFHMGFIIEEGPGVFDVVVTEGSFSLTDTSNGSSVPFTGAVEVQDGTYLLHNNGAYAHAAWTWSEETGGGPGSDPELHPSGVSIHNASVRYYELAQHDYFSMVNDGSSNSTFELEVTNGSYDLEVLSIGDAPSTSFGTPTNGVVTTYSLPVGSHHLTLTGETDMTFSWEWDSGGGDNQCPGDNNGDGYVDFNDLLTILSAWGPCSG